jgi:ABC-type sugar transport system permease subunit
MVIKRLLEKNYKIVMVIPFIIFTLMLLVYPLVQVVITSTTNYGITRAGSYIGISNYLELMKDDVFLQSVLITAKFTITTMTFSMIIGVILAVVFRTIKLPKKKIIMGLMVIPMLMTPSAIGLLWQQMFNPLFGIINKILSFFSLPTSLWISSSKTVFKN